MPLDSIKQLLVTITQNTFRHCRVLFIWTTILETAVYIISMNKNVYEWPETECKRPQIQGEVNVLSCCVSNFLQSSSIFSILRYLDTSAIFYKYIEITDGCETWIHIMSRCCSDIYSVQTLTSIFVSAVQFRKLSNKRATCFNNREIHETNGIQLGIFGLLSHMILNNVK